MVAAAAMIGSGTHNPSRAVLAMGPGGARHGIARQVRHVVAAEWHATASTDTAMGNRDHDLRRSGVHVAR